AGVAAAVRVQVDADRDALQRPVDDDAGQVLRWRRGRRGGTAAAAAAAGQLNERSRDAAVQRRAHVTIEIRVHDPSNGWCVALPLHRASWRTSRDLFLGR